MPTRTIIVEGDEIAKAIAQYLTELPQGARYRCALRSAGDRFWAEVRYQTDAKDTTNTAEEL